MWSVHVYIDFNGDLGNLQLTFIYPEFYDCSPLFLLCHITFYLQARDSSSDRRLIILRSCDQRLFITDSAPRRDIVKVACLSCDVPRVLRVVIWFSYSIKGNDIVKGHRKTGCIVLTILSAKRFSTQNKEPSSITCLHHAGRPRGVLTSSSIPANSWLPIGLLLLFAYKCVRYIHVWPCMHFMYVFHLTTIYGNDCVMKFWVKTICVNIELWISFVYAG